MIATSSLALAYNAENRLVSVRDSVTETHVYDSDGNRVKATVNGVTSVYMGKLYEEFFPAPTATSTGGPTTTPTATPAGGADYATTELGDAWNFDEGDQENISYWSSGIASHSASGGFLNLNTNSTNFPYFHWNGLNIATATYHRLKIQLKAGSGTAVKVHTYTPTGDYIGYCVVGSAVANQWTLVEKELAGSACWTGSAVGRLRIGFDQSNQTIEIDYVRVESGAVAQSTGKVRGLARNVAPRPPILGVSAAPAAAPLASPRPPTPPASPTPSTSTATRAGTARPAKTGAGWRPAPTGCGRTRRATWRSRWRRPGGP